MLTRITPFFVTVLAVIILKETVDNLNWIIFFPMIVGCILIIKPNSELFNPASIIAVLSACSAAIAYIMIKAIGKEESAYTMRYSELGFGQSAIQFLELCATKNKTGSFVSTNRKMKSRVDKALREHFNMGNNQSIISHRKKAHNYYPLFSIWHYDEDRNSRYGSMY